MARQIVVARPNGSPCTFDLSKVERSRLYGRRMRVALDPEGQPCVRAALTEDGSLMIKSGMTSQGYFDEDGLWYPSRELVGLDAEGRPLEKVDSTLGVEQALEGPVPVERVLDLRVSSVYALSPVDVDEALVEELRGGAIFEFRFNYRADYQAETALLLASADGDLFALVGRPTEPAWNDPQEVVPAFVGLDEEEDDDDLDFEMF